MANINLVTGYTGNAHIKSEEDALLNRFLLGQTSALIELTNTFNDTDCDIDCDCILDGRLIRTDGDVNLTFTKPSSGYYRNDGIYIAYTKDLGGVEGARLLYCEGTQNASQATAEANAGTPTFEADIVDSAILQLFSIAWNNEQTKEVTQTISTAPFVETLTLLDLSSNPHTVQGYALTLAPGVKLHIVNAGITEGTGSFNKGSWTLQYLGTGAIISGVANISLFINTRPPARIQAMQNIYVSPSSITIAAERIDYSSLGAVGISALFITLE